VKLLDCGGLYLFGWFHVASETQARTSLLFN
jgi:hypothetical protein